MQLGITIKRSKVVWRQVVDQLRRKILSQELPPGTKLPSTAELAIQIGTDVPTVHRALSELVCEGLLTRTPRIGTHVTQWEKGLLRLGVYHGRNILMSPVIGHRVLEAEVQNAAAQLKISVQVWSDPRPEAKQDTVLPVIEYAARERIIQGLISTEADSLRKKWLHKLPIPVAMMGAAHPDYVDFDRENFFAVAIQALREKGCHSAAYIAPHTSPSDFYDSFRAHCAKAGIETRPEWIPASPSFVEHRDYDACGYSKFRALWRHDPKPEGLVVYPDEVTTGVVMGILAERINVPQDLKVVLHRNKEVGLFCPFEATLVTSRFAEAARGLINQLDSILKGREPKEVRVLHEAGENPAA